MAALTRARWIHHSLGLKSRKAANVGRLKRNHSITTHVATPIVRRGVTWPQRAKKRSHIGTVRIVGVNVWANGLGQVIHIHGLRRRSTRPMPLQGRRVASCSFGMRALHRRDPLFALSALRADKAKKKMSLYGVLLGESDNSDRLYEILGLKEYNVQRYRDIFGVKQQCLVFRSRPYYLRGYLLFHSHQASTFDASASSCHVTNRIVQRPQRYHGNNNGLHRMQIHCVPETFSIESGTRRCGR